MSAATMPDKVRRILHMVSDEAEAVAFITKAGYDQEDAQLWVREWQAERAAQGSSRLGLLAQRVELGDLMRKGVPRPDFLPSESLGDRLFYERALFIVSGHKKSGKSWAMTTTALDCVRAGRPAVYIDFENGRDRFARRLLQLDAAPEEADGPEGLHYIPFPRDLDGDHLRADLTEIAVALPGAFVVVDSLRGLIARIGGREPNVNDPQVIERASAPLREAVDADGLTVGVIDHAKMTGSDSDEYATANSAAKEQAVDAVYFWTKVEPYNRDVAGTVKLKTTDDRDGELVFERYWQVGGQGDEPVRFTATDRPRSGLVASSGTSASSSLTTQASRRPRRTFARVCEARTRGSTRPSTT